VKTYTKSIVAIWGICAASACHAEAAPDIATLESKLLGRWQQGFTEKLQSGTPSRATAFVGGDVLEFAADHTMRTFLKCGPERQQFEARGVEYPRAKWTFVDAKTLRMVMSLNGQSFTQEAEIHIDGNTFRFVSSKNRNEEFGRYDGLVPIPCNGRQ
jgi:hypothetical protein